MAECKNEEGDFVEDDEPTGTQPVECPIDEMQPNEELHDQESFQDHWGWLHPTPKSKLKSVGLENDRYTFGRGAPNDVIFRAEEFQDSQMFLSISSNQFEILREESTGEVRLVYLYDLSMNGTFVNCLKVGKGKKVLLSTNDEIALVFPSNKVYVFVDNTFINEWYPQEMKRRYQLKMLLGQGAYGEVRMAFDKKSNKDVAIKKIKKRRGKEEKVYNEINILKKLKHPFIVSMDNVIDTMTNLYIVLEYISGGTLDNKLRRCNGKLSNDETKVIFYQLAQALEYLHSEGVAHRDLKPENVLLYRTDEADLVKLTDFGLSKICNDENETDLKTMCGTIIFVAPEVLTAKDSGGYTHQVDVWSLGISLFKCLCGKHPFRLDFTSMTVYEQIIRGSYTLTGVTWKGISSKAVNLTRRMLVVDPIKRITIQKILAHPWFQDDTMKRKVRRLVKSVSEGKENLHVEDVNLWKRARYEKEETIWKS